MKKKNIIKRLFPDNIKLILALLLGSFLLRLSLHSIYTYSLDHGTFIAWGRAMLAHGPSGFYASVWSDYLPGYLYVLWLMAFLEKTFGLAPVLVYKLPSMLADTGVVFLIYKIVSEKFGIRKATISALAFSLNLAVLANSTLWGQVDIITVFFSLLSVYCFRRNEYLSALFLATGFAVKPQAAMAVPVLFYMMLVYKWKLWKMVRYALVSAAALAFVFAPFAAQKELSIFINERVSATLSQYKYTSINAFNVWGLNGFWKLETNENILGILTSSVVVLLALFANRKREGREYLLLSLFFFTNFMLFTRMHERHMLPAIAPLAIAAASAPLLWLVYVSLSATYVLNMLYSAYWLDHNFATIIPDTAVKAIIIVNILALIIIFRESIKKKYSQIPKLASNALSSWRTGLVDKKADVSHGFAKRLLLLIFTFSLITRVVGLETPKEDYFDEIYHAFTARSLAQGEPYVWHWQTNNPPGFAYEWTHPPLAKEIMAGSIIVFGEHSLAWRLPGALLATLCVLLVYKISYEIFKRRDISLIASALLSLDGLVFTMSRIGTADVYFLFFMLLTYWLFLREKHMFSALALGLAASSKWSAIWFVPLLVLTQILLRKKLSWRHLHYLVLPPLVYVASYLPMFIHGYNFEHFIGMQKQMWWYHSGLKATHPYTSPWWSWPLMQRPVYLYQNFDAVRKFVANIYAIGNPVVFWFGAVGVLFSAVEAVRKRSLELALVVLAYLIFFVPWALSPRIMFIYHYLPSLPFLAIASGYTLHKLPRLTKPVILVGVVMFIYFYPHWSAIPVPEWLDKTYYWFSSWR